MTFVASDKVEMPDTLGQAVGEQRWELLARLAGNEVRMHCIIQYGGSFHFLD